MWILRIVLSVLGIALCSLAANDNNHFFNPASLEAQLNDQGNEIWAVGETHTIQWITTNATYNVSFWQQDLTQGSAHLWKDVYTATGDGAGNKSFDWTVELYGADLKHSPVFFFWIESDDHKTPIETSAYFNITDKPIVSSSSASSSPITTSSSSTNGGSAASATSSSASSTGSGTSNTAGAAGAQSTSSAPSSDSSSNKSSHNLAVGLGAGLGVGIPVAAALLGGIAFLLWRKRKQPTQENKPTQPPMHHTDYYGPSHPHESPAPQYAKVAPEQNAFSHELPGDAHPIHEAPTSAPRAELPGTK